MEIKCILLVLLFSMSYGIQQVTITSPSDDETSDKEGSFLQQLTITSPDDADTSDKEGSFVQQDSDVQLPDDSEQKGSFLQQDSEVQLPDDSEQKGTFLQQTDGDKPEDLDTDESTTGGLQDVVVF